MATPSKAVHFKTPAAVMDGYEKQDVPAFALFSGSQLICKYQGDDMDQGKQTLQFWITHLVKEQSAAIHTIAFFEDVPAKGIKSNTPYDCSFNFRFLDTPMGYLPPELYNLVGGGQRQLIDELTALRLEVSDLKKQVEEGPDEPDEVEKPGIGAIMLKSFEPLLPVLADRVIAALFPPQPGQGHVARVSGLGIGEQVSAQEQLRVNDAVRRLRKTVPDIADIMEKLARLSEVQPATFNTYMAMLRSMNI